MKIRIEVKEEHLIEFIRGKKFLYIYPDLEIEIYPPNYSESQRVQRAFEDGIQAEKSAQRMEDIVFNIKKKK